MQDDYIIVHKSVLPDYYIKVLETKQLIESGKVKEISQATKMTGISRSTFYKYKDYIILPDKMESGRKAVLSMLLDHEPGILSSLLSKVSAAGYSVLTITQSLPIYNTASVTLSLDASYATATVSELLASIAATKGISNVKLVAIE